MSFKSTVVPQLAMWLYKCRRRGRADAAQMLRSLIYVDYGKKAKKYTGGVRIPNSNPGSLRADGVLGSSIWSGLKPSYECNFYLHNFKLIPRSSHAPQSTEYKKKKMVGRRNRSGSGKEHTNNKGSKWEKNQEIKEKTTENLSQKKRINGIKLSLFRSNARAWT